ncbi:hypothetical protein PSACC_02575 [Paramicrosporidium saccamoebae]|uniref:Uncharacterized protein n=1 Tax=Paramicrosporidium saccamoebae TaxID=1246581 RepID=A0A2H9TIP8_9FUNG|nr:hypothetical protein PSACC_02575 [Paramicrosporidium saccamoebae]
MQPFLARHQAQIENTANEWSRRAQTFVGTTVTEFVQRVNTYIRELAAQQSEVVTVTPIGDFDDISSAGPRIVEITESPKKK